MPERWTRAIIRFRWAVIASWVVVFVVAFMLSSGLADVLKSESSLPGTDAQKVEDILKDTYGQRTYGTFTLVVRGDAGSAEALAPGVEAAAERAAAEVPTGSVAAVQQVSDRVVSGEIASTLQPHDAGDYTAAMRQAVGGGATGSARGGRRRSEARSLA